MTADVIMPGPVHPAEPYYSAFDVFLNTSIYEGLSIAILEAICRGCPVVSADAGGNAEALGPNDVLIEDSSDVDAYSRAIIEVASRPQRRLNPLPADQDLVPRLWALLGRHGVPRAPVRSRPEPTTLILTENLNVGGPQRSLTNLLLGWPERQTNCRRRPRSIVRAWISCAVSRMPGSSSSAFTASAP